jgi:putative transposase
MLHIDDERGDLTRTAACAALAFPRATYYARKASANKPTPVHKQRKRSVRALSDQEREYAITTLTSPQYVDMAPASIVASLLDRGIYICSVRTLYRLLALFVVVMERRRITRHANHVKPELLASGPRQLFTWDITKVKGPYRGVVYNLYVMIDVFSRYVVGWVITHREQQEIAREFLKTICEREQIGHDQLIIHADNGPAMRSMLVEELLEQLRVTKSHSRPYCSNDNPYIEAHFRTLKYSPEYPERFASIEEATNFFRELFIKYNNHMYHSGIQMLTPATVHYGQATEIIKQRQTVLQEAFASHPERFVKGQPVHKQIPSVVYINRPMTEDNCILNN